MASKSCVFAANSATCAAPAGRPAVATPAPVLVKPAPAADAGASAPVTAVKASVPVAPQAAVDAGDFGAQAKFGGVPVSAQARSFMQALEQSPTSELNEKLRLAGIDRPVKPFSESFAVLADARDAASIPPAKLDAAMREAVKFAADLYVAEGGRPSHFVKAIKLVPQRSDGISDYFRTNDNLASGVDGTLQVEVPTTGQGVDGVLSADDIGKEWAAGKHLSDPRMAAMWPILNPFGEARRVLGQVIRQAAERFGVDLDKLIERLVKGEPGARTAFRGFVEKHIPASVPTLSNESTIQKAALERLDGASDQEVLRYAQAWAAAIRDPDLQRHASGSSVMYAATQDKPNVVSFTTGILWGGVTNSHLVNVQVDAIFGNAEHVARFFTQEPSRRWIINASPSLLIGGVATHDTVDVQAAITGLNADTQRVLPSLALERALGI